MTNFACTKFHNAIHFYHANKLNTKKHLKAFLYKNYLIKETHK